MPNNKNAVRYLENRDIDNANYIVGQLIEGGFIEDIIPTEPELLVEAAKKWLSRTGKKTSKEDFGFASGWNTEGWEQVTGEVFIHKPEKIRNIFAALVIMAKEAEVQL